MADWPAFAALAAVCVAETAVAVDSAPRPVKLGCPDPLLTDVAANLIHSIAACLCHLRRLLPHWPAQPALLLKFHIFSIFKPSVKNYESAFSQAFPDNFLSYSCILKLFLMLQMSINVNDLTKFNISIKF